MTLSVKEMASKIEAAMDAYSVGEPIMTDAEYDTLYEAFKDAAPNHPLLNRVGGLESTKLVLVPLAIPMGSLQKIKNDESALERWKKKHPGPYHVSEKIDGISVQLVAEGKTRRLLSRGKGTEGHDISRILPFVGTAYKRLSMQQFAKVMKSGDVIRGEVVLSKKGFDLLGEKYTNPRSACKGIAFSEPKSDEWKRAASLLMFVAYDVQSSDAPITEKFEYIESIDECATPWSMTVDDFDLSWLDNLHDIRWEKAESNIDGLVVYDASQGYGAYEGNPDHAFAFKKTVDTQTEIVRVTGVHWKAGRRGQFQPRILFEPVMLAGSTFTAVSGANAAYIRDNGIGPGAKLRITNNIIPVIVGVIQSVKPDLPTKPYSWSGVDAVALDTDTDEVRTSVLMHFIKTLGVAGIGPSTASLLVESGYETGLDLLSTDAETLSTIDGIGLKGAESMLASLREKLETAPLAVLMDAAQTFGRGFGRRKCESALAWIDVFTDRRSVDEIAEDLGSRPGFSPATATQFAGGIQDFLSFIQELRANGIVREKTTQKAAPATAVVFSPGYAVVFSGFRDADLEARATAMGATIRTSVSSKTSLVVYAGKESGKVQEARKKGIEVIERAEFERRLDVQ